MKTRKTYGYMSFFLLPIVLVIALAFFGHLPNYVFYPNRIINALFALLCVFLFIGPWGSVTLDHQNPPFPKAPRIFIYLKILALQVSMVLLMFGLHRVIYKQLPVHTNYAAFTPSIKTLWLDWLLYPWPIIAVLAVALAYTAYNLKENAFISSLTQSVLHNRHDSFFTHLFGVFTRNTISFGLATTIALYMLSFASMMAGPNTHIINTGGNTAAYVTAIFILACAFLPFVKRGLAKLLRRQIPSVLGIVAFTLIGSIIVLVISGIVFSAQLDPGQAAKPTIVYNVLSHMRSERMWLFFSANWWLSLSPACALIIARLLKGFSIRVSLLMLLTLPALLSALSYFNLYPQLSDNSAKILICLGFLLFFTILGLKANRSMLVQIHLPKLGEYKSRDHHFFFRQIMRFSAATLFLYLPIGIMYVALTLYISNFFYCVMLAIAGIGFILELLSKRAPKA